MDIYLCLVFMFVKNVTILIYYMWAYLEKQYDI